MKKLVPGVLLAALVVTVLLGVPNQSSANAYSWRDTVRLFEGPNPMGELLWTIERVPYYYTSRPAWWIFEGPSSYYPPLYTFTDEHLFEGSGVYGPIVLTLDHNTAFEGPSFFGTPLFHFSGSRLFEGNSTRGDILYYFSGQRVFEGANATGDFLLNATIDIASFSGPLELVIGFLLSGQTVEPLPTPEPPPPPVPPPPPPPYSR